VSPLPRAPAQRRYASPAELLAAPASASFWGCAARFRARPGRGRGGRCGHLVTWAREGQVSS